MIGDREVRVHGDPEAFAALYDAQAARLHAYCWSLVGDQAPAAVREVFAAAAYPGGMRGPDMPGRMPEGGLGAVWLYGRARAECLRRGLVTVISGRDPLLRAAARLRADQREVLVLAADLPLAHIARVLCLPPATTGQLVHAARARFEQVVLDALLADPATATHGDIIDAFETATLGRLLVQRAPAPPRALRDHVVDLAARRMGPLVVISPQSKPAHEDEVPKGPRHARATAPVIGIAAASVAVIVGAVAAGTAHHEASSAGGGQRALGPTSTGQQQSPSNLGGNPANPGNPGDQTAPSPDGPSPTTSASQPVGDVVGEAPSPASSDSSDVDPSSPNASAPDSQSPSSSGDDSDQQGSSSGSPSGGASSPSEKQPASSPSDDDRLLPDLPSIIGGILPGTTPTATP
jgi:hypothetical protein